MKDIFADNKEPERATEAQEKWDSHPPFDRKHLRAIELALRAAWEKLLKDRSKAPALSSADEVYISHLIREALDDLRQAETGGVPGYSFHFFDRPQLGAEVLTPLGKIKKPDIVFGLAGAKRPGVSKSIRDGIFVECKLLENKSGKNIANYCQQGLKRFVIGDYAAWMREGMMLAYVRSSQGLPGALAARLSKQASKEELATDGKLVKCTLTRLAPRVYISIHRRDSVKLDIGEGGEGKKPGPIAVRHLWLHV